MNNVVLFIVGPPGAGKTTIARSILGQLHEFSYVEKPKWTIGPGAYEGIEVCAAGHYKGNTFDGADTVPYNGVNDCLRYWRDNLRHIPLTIFDGDRFSHKGVLGFFSKINDAIVTVAYVNTTKSELERRRKERGSNQNHIWIKGRTTKARRFADMLDNCIDIYNMSTFEAISRIRSELINAALRYS